MDREKLLNTLLTDLSAFGYVGRIKPKLGRTEAMIEFSRTDRKFQQHMKELGWSDFKGDFKEWTCVRDQVKIRIWWMGKTFLSIDGLTSTSSTARIIISMGKLHIDKKGSVHGH